MALLEYKAHFKIYDFINCLTNNYKHILPNITHITVSKGNQTMNFGQLIKYKERSIFLQKSCRNEARRLIPNLFCFLKKLYMR